MYRSIVLGVSILAIGHITGAMLWSERCRFKPRKPNPRADLNKVLKRVEHHNWRTKLTEKELIEAAIEGIFLRYDPDGMYLNPDAVGDYFFSGFVPRSGYVPIGYRFERRLIVTSVDWNSGLMKKGVFPGDEILEIDGKSVYEYSASETATKSFGKRGKRVRFKLRSATSGKVSVLELRYRTVSFNSAE